MGSLAVCLAVLLHTRSATKYEKLKKFLDFSATTENISVISILLLNPKHSSYWEENYPS